MRLSLAALATLSLTTAGAAVAAPQSRDPSINPPRAERCFAVNDVQRYHGDGDRALIVRTRQDRYYRIGFAAPCPNVRRPDANVTLVARGASSWICKPIDVSVMVTASQFPLTCAVSDIHPMSPEEVRALPAKNRP